MTLYDWIDATFYNDLQDIPIFFIKLLIAFLILGVSIFFHELGHALYLKLKLKRSVRIHFFWNSFFNFYWEAGDKEDIQYLSDAQYHDYIMFGVLAGTLPILMSVFFWPPFILLLIPYGVGSWHDIKIMIKINKENE